MIELITIEGKCVRLVDIDGDEFVGMVTDYIYPDDNEPEGEEGIIMDIKGYNNPIQFNAHEIKTIEIIK